MVSFLPENGRDSLGTLSLRGGGGLTLTLLPAKALKIPSTIAVTRTPNMATITATNTLITAATTTAPGGVKLGLQRLNQQWRSKTNCWSLASLVLSVCGGN